MDGGKVAEFDTVLNLFDKADSIFRSLCDEANLQRTDIVRIRAEHNVQVWILMFLEHELSFCLRQCEFNCNFLLETKMLESLLEFQISEFCSEQSFQVHHEDRFWKERLPASFYISNRKHQRRNMKTTDFIINTCRTACLHVQVLNTSHVTHGCFLFSCLIFIMNRLLFYSLSYFL